MTIPWNMTGMESVMKAKCLCFRKYANTFLLPHQYLLTITEPLAETNVNGPPFNREWLCWTWDFQSHDCEEYNLWKATPCSPVEINNVSDEITPPSWGSKICYTETTEQDVNSKLSSASWLFLAVCLAYFRSWTWRQNAPPKSQWTSIWLHGITPQKTVIFGNDHTGDH
jgi:hypothetical protein